jgi:DNA-binding transcriptional regulator/RsmH inhibitor MraZ
MSELLSFDARGRITLPRSLREGLGERVVAIRTPHGVVLHPIPAHVALKGSAAAASGEEGALGET